jgi:hypothetical protein
MSFELINYFYFKHAAIGTSIEYLWNINGHLWNILAIAPDSCGTHGAVALPAGRMENGLVPDSE